MNQCSSYAANSKTPPGFKLKFGNTSGLNGLGESLTLYAHQSRQASKEEKLGPKKNPNQFQDTKQIKFQPTNQKKKKKGGDRKKRKIHIEG